MQQTDIFKKQSFFSLLCDACKAEKQRQAIIEQKQRERLVEIISLLMLIHHTTKSYTKAFWVYWGYGAVTSTDKKKLMACLMIGPLIGKLQ